MYLLSKVNPGLVNVSPVSALLHFNLIFLRHLSDLQITSVASLNRLSAEKPALELTYQSRKIKKTSRMFFLLFLSLNICLKAIICSFEVSQGKLHFLNEMYHPITLAGQWTLSRRYWEEGRLCECVFIVLPRL